MCRGAAVRAGGGAAEGGAGGGGGGGSLSNSNPFSCLFSLPEISGTVLLFSLQRSQSELSFVSSHLKWNSRPQLNGDAANLYNPVLGGIVPPAFVPCGTRFVWSSDHKNAEPHLSYSQSYPGLHNLRLVLASKSYQHFVLKVHMLRLSRHSQ